MSEAAEDLEWMVLETFPTKEEAKALADLLSENAIESDLVIDANMGGDPLGLDFQNRGADSCIVRVRAGKISEARRLLEVAIQSTAASNAEALGQEMFKDFSDEELLEVLQKPDEWNLENVAVAQKILASHGKSYTKEDLDRFFTERVEDLRKPQTVKWGSFAGAFAMASCAILLDVLNFFHLESTNFLYALLIAGLLAFLGFLASLNWTYRKKRLPNGEKVFLFSNAARHVGFVSLVLSALGLGLTVIDIAARTI